MKLIRKYIEEIINSIIENKQKFYNEAELQHEIGFHLRAKLEGKVRVFFERPIKYLEIEDRLIKKEIDLLLEDTQSGERFIIEIKAPIVGRGRHPETMFDFIKDIRFIEQIKKLSGVSGVAILLTDDEGYYGQKGKSDGIYKYFRGLNILEGAIKKPTGRKTFEITMSNAYELKWERNQGDQRYIIVSI